jgi:replicative DNA helicase
VSTLLFTDYFHPDFQELVLGLMAHDPDFCARVHGVIRPEYFAAAVYKAICTSLQAHWAAQEQLPSPAILAAAVSTQVEDQPTRELYVQKVHQLYELSADDLNREFIQAEVLQFVQRAEFAFAIGNAYEQLRTADIPATHAALERVLAIPGRFGRLGLDLHQDYHRIFNVDNIPKFRTGFTRVDLGMRGGAQPGELVIVLAKQKGGKSQCLVNFAVGLMLRGYVPVLYSLEMYEDDLLARACASLTALPTNNLTEYAEILQARILGSTHFTSGRLLIKEFPGRATTVLDIQSHIELVRGELPPQLRNKVVPVIDYIDLLLPNTRSKDPNQETLDVYTLVRNLGRRIGAPVFSATQGNRESLLADEINAGHQQFYNRGMICDYMLGLAQSKVDEAARRFRLVWVLNRHDHPYAIYFREQWDQARMIEITPAEFEAMTQGQVLVGQNLQEESII